MQGKLKENIFKSEHLADLFVEREGAAIFLKWARIPRSWARFPRHLFMLNCIVSYSSYGTTVAQISRKKIMGTIFEK